MPLQLAGAKALFAALRVYYVPRLAVRYLRRYDVTFALQSFFQSLGVSYDVLTSPQNLLFEEHRGLLEDWVGILLAVEEAVRETELDYLAIEERVGGDRQEVETLVGQLERCGSIWRRTHALRAKWPQYLAFLGHAELLLKDWQRATNDDLERVEAVWQDFATLEERIAVARRRHEDLGLLLRTLGLGRSAQADIVAERISAGFKQLLDGVDSGAEDPVSVLSRLDELLDDMDAALKTDTSWSEEEQREKQREALAAFAFFGLPITSNERVISKRYREHAMRWHPDQNKEPDAEERFKMLNRYFEVLKQYVRSRTPVETAL